VGSSGQNFITSDARFKTNVSSNGIKGLDFIMKLRPVQYQLKAKDLDLFLRKNMSEESKKFIEQTDYSQAESIVRSGFIAQEVEEAAKESGFNFDGVYTPKNDNDYYAVSYSSLVVPLVKGMQEQQKIIESQNQKIDQLQKQIDELKALIKTK
jgi:hypothetical protein